MAISGYLKRITFLNALGQSINVGGVGTVQWSYDYTLTFNGQRFTESGTATYRGITNPYYTLGNAGIDLDDPDYSDPVWNYIIADVDFTYQGETQNISFSQSGVLTIPDPPGYNASETLVFGQPQEKAINPTPADGSTNIETDPTADPAEQHILLQWEPGDEDYPPDSYMVYVGGGVWFDEGIPTTVPYLDYSGKIYGPSTTWRVDSIYGETTIEGDEWTFTPSSFFETTYTVPNSPSPINASIAGYFSGISCAWKGDSRSISFELWRGINGAAATLYSTTTSRLSVNTGLTNGQTVIWHVKEQVPAGWIEGPSWSYTVSSSNYPGSADTVGSVKGCVPMPTKKILILAYGNSLYYGDI